MKNPTNFKKSISKFLLAKKHSMFKWTQQLYIDLDEADWSPANPYFMEY